MAKKQLTESTLLISRIEEYADCKISINLDPERDIKFNAGEKIKVTEEELKQIGNHRWLIVEENNGN